MCNCLLVISAKNGGPTLPIEAPVTVKVLPQTLFHGTFTEAATELIVRSADGVLRKCRNLCLASMLEAV